MTWLLSPWPWYIAGPLIGLMVPLLLWIGGRTFGVSSNLRHLCAAVLPARPAFFRYDWRKQGLWNLTFAVGIMLGGFLAVQLLGAGTTPALSDATILALRDLGLGDPAGLLPAELLSWEALLTGPGLMFLIGGGFLVGFGARYAGGCTSGHAISGLANLQGPSLVAVLGFFAGGLLVTHLLLPWLF